MTFDELILKFGLPLAMLIVVTVAFVRGYVVPRFIYDLERTGRLDQEKRFDRSMDLSEALLDELKKAPRGNP